MSQILTNVLLKLARIALEALATHVAKKLVTAAFTPRTAPAAA